MRFTANTSGRGYVATVSTNGYYDVTLDAFGSALASGVLSTVADGANSVYGPPRALPASSFRNSNYFRDVVSVPS